MRSAADTNNRTSIKVALLQAMIFNKSNLPLIASYLLVALLFAASVHNGFFWDTIQLGSLHANYYYTTNFRDILLPDPIDSGHIPAFGMYLALIWKIFGRSIVISHLAMLPFVFGIIWQLQKLVKRFINKEYYGLALLLILIDPTLLSQIILISPDVALVFFFLAALNSILDNRKVPLVVAIAFLFLTSMRGMMVSLCLLIIDIFRNIKFEGSLRAFLLKLLKRGLLYLPAFFIFLSFSYYHIRLKGWIGFHDDSPWAEFFSRVGFTGFLRNIGILGWRLLDFGRIGIWIVFIILITKFRAKVLDSKDTRLLIIFFLIFSVLLPANMIWAKNLLGHRYLIPIYLLFSLLCANILFNNQMHHLLRKTLISLWIIMLATGNLWVYPDKIAQGWDSTLAHLPYYKIRSQAIQYLNEQDVNFQNVQSFFPNTATIDAIDLNNDQRFFTDFNNCCEYVIYSNVFNINDDDYEKVKTDYILVKEFKRGSLHMDICRRKMPDQF